MHKLKNLKYIIPFFTFFIATFLLILFLFLDHSLFSKQLKKIFIENSCNKIKEREHYFIDSLQNKNDILWAIRKNQLFIEYLQRGQINEENIAFLFEEIIRSNKSMMQIRFLDQNGMEKIRFDRKESLSHEIIKIENLQNKSSRDYFKENITNKEKIWFSKLDVNIERKKIDVPYKGTFRIILPVIFEHKFQGMLVLNYFAERYLERFLQAVVYDTILIDSDGFIISHYDQTKNWSKYQKKPFIVEKKYLKYLENDLFCDGQITIKKLNLPFENDLFLILRLNKVNQLAHTEIYNKRITTLVCIYLFVIAIICVILYLVFKKFEENELEIQILTKSQKQKDILLLQKSKMASMGEMLANIAHQWRQPLTIIALHTMHLEKKVHKGDANKEFIFAYVNNVTSTLKNISKTMEDFSNFFKPNKEKITFKIEDLIKEVLVILEKVLTDNKIRVEFSQNTKTEYRGYKNELLHVFLNIISNSKDALQLQNCEQRFIEIDIKEENKNFIITIEDNGKGIDKDIFLKVYDPYFTTKSDKNGIGIGLYMSKTIIERSFKGKISLENKKSGILCTLYLPKNLS